MICVQCAAGGGGILVFIMAAVAAIEGAEWVLARIFWILGTGLLCAVLAALAVARLMRWAQRRDARPAALWTVREAPRPVQLRVEPVLEPPRAERPAAIEYHVHHHYADGPEPARVATIPGTAGDAITGREP